MDVHAGTKSGMALKVHGRDFKFYPKRDGKPWRGFRSGSAMMPPRKVVLVCGLAGEPGVTPGDEGGGAVTGVVGWEATHFAKDDFKLLLNSVPCQLVPHPRQRASLTEEP